MSNNAWIRLGETLSIGQQVTDNFGRCVSLNTYGNILAVGSSTENNNSVSSAGAVRTYYYDGSDNKWKQFGLTLNSSTENEQFGFSVSIYGFSDNLTGTILIVGGLFAKKNNTDFGAVYIYRYNISGTWVLLKTIYGNQDKDIAGFSSVIKGKTMVYGAPSEVTTQTGYAEVYYYFPDRAKLTGSLGRM